ncbi:MAG TPA: sigma-70 family RNA polymerase sigma factor [Verrucomicrobiota bacterium]|nr:sigma-70 family RNA polymerase sigma factor [Verrucomicrobiota bacterium]
MIVALNNPKDDSRLLREYAQDCSEAVFADLVRRHVNLVYSAALRQVGGDAPAAEDVTQSVFTELARQAERLARHPALTGWLYTTTRRVAGHAVRAEFRRQRREQQIQMMQDLAHDSTEAELDWERVRPVLDAAMHELAEPDRLAVLLRHFERRPLAEVGDRLGLTENAARMRADRALEKLRALLAKRGVTSTASALVLTLGNQGIIAAPAALATTVANAATAAAATTASTLALFPFMASMNFKAMGAALLVISAGTALFLQYRSAERLRATNAELRDQVARAIEDAQAAQRKTAQNSDEQSRWQQPQAELLRLRGEVSRLRQQLAAGQPAAVSSDQRPTPEPPAELDEEASRALGIRRLNEAKLLMLGFFLFAGDNGDRYPESLDVALARAKSEISNPEQLGFIQALQTADYEIMYQGSPSGIANPSQAIVVRQREAWRSASGWMRTYGFADGHSEVHRSVDGDFTEFESRHQARPPTPPVAGETAEPGQ